MNDLSLFVGILQAHEPDFAGLVRLAEHHTYLHGIGLYALGPSYVVIRVGPLAPDGGAEVFGATDSSVAISLYSRWIDQTIAYRKRSAVVYS